jgi:hypothetical protein
MRWISKLRPSPAMAVALLALFVSMGGVGYAAAKIGSAQIKNNSVRGKDIRNSTILGKDVKNSGLTGKDVKADSLTGNDILESSLGQVPSAKSADTAKAVGPNGVDTTAIQDNAVTTTKIADNAVTNPKIADNAVTSNKIADNNVTGADTGSVSIRSSIVTVVDDATGGTANGGTAIGTTACVGTQQMLSGGALWAGSVTAANSQNLHVVHSYPQSANAWSVRGWNNTGGSRNMTVYAVCLN